MSLDQTTIAELKKILENEKGRLQKELERLADAKDTPGSYETRFPEDIGSRSDENATEVEEYTDNLGVEKNLEQQLRNTIDALARIDDGTYGTDENTGEQITLERLKAYPAARTNIAS